MRVVLPHPSTQHTWPQLLVCLSILCHLCISSLSQLSPVRFSNNQEQEKTRSNKGAREKAHIKACSEFLLLSCSPESKIPSTDLNGPSWWQNTVCAKGDVRESESRMSFRSPMLSCTLAHMLNHNFVLHKNLIWICFVEYGGCLQISKHGPLFIVLMSLLSLYQGMNTLVRMSVCICVCVCMCVWLCVCEYVYGCEFQNNFKLRQKFIKNKSFLSLEIFGKKLWTWCLITFKNHWFYVSQTRFLLHCHNTIFNIGCIVISMQLLFILVSDPIQDLCILHQALILVSPHSWMSSSGTDPSPSTTHFT
jgi:hypothetical protein